MRILPETVKKNKEGVPAHRTVWVHNADIILEFLEQTFMPLSYFINHPETYTEGVDRKFFQDVVDEQKVLFPNQESVIWQTRKIYDLYLVWRNSVPYTKPVETLNTFSTILRKMKYSKNGWEFLAKRVSEKQLPALAPFLPRSQVSEELRHEFPVPKPDLSKSQVEGSLDN